MLIEDTSTKCPSCRSPLVWLSRITRLRDEREVEESNFGCDARKRQYVYVDGELGERRKERDTHAESAAMIRSELEAALRHRCPDCGGPISDGREGRTFTCLWCHEQYSVEGGELVRKLDDPRLMKPRPRMSDFYALQSKR